jgi:hypothetical protein
MRRIGAFGTDQAMRNELRFDRIERRILAAGERDDAVSIKRLDQRFEASRVRGLEQYDHRLRAWQRAYAVPYHGFSDKPAQLPQPMALRDAKPWHLEAWHYRSFIKQVHRCHPSAIYETDTGEIRKSGEASAPAAIVSCEGHSSG